MRMISDQERREVAAKLREKKKDFFGVRSFFPQDIILYRSLYMQAIDECLPDGDCCFDGLADLIDRPVAEAVDRKELGYDTCGRCGLDFAVFQPIPGGLGEAVYARHCPNCGAKLTWKESE